MVAAHYVVSIPFVYLSIRSNSIRSSKIRDSLVRIVPVIVVVRVRQPHRGLVVRTTLSWRHDPSVRSRQTRRRFRCDWATMKTWMMMLPY